MTRRTTIEASTEAGRAEVLAPRRNPFLFIVGCPRSGTTLLGRMLDAHPALAVIHETRWIVRFFEKRIGIAPDGRVTPEVVAALLGFRQFGQLGIGRQTLEDLIDGTAPPYSSFVTSIFDAYGAIHGKVLVGDKCPRYVRSLTLLHGLWPAARFVHLIRDGRDVCLSIVNWRAADRILGHFPTWATDRLSTAALWWEWHVRLGREGRDLLTQDHYLEVRYETLIATPPAVSAEVCEFLSLPYSDAMLRFHEGRIRADPGLDAKQAWLPPKAGLRDWKSQMQPDDLERVEAVAGDLLVELGYQRAVSRPSATASEHAHALRLKFAEHVRGRGQRLPQEWGP
jgi:Sulfotransferase family